MLGLKLVIHLCLPVKDGYWEQSRLTGMILVLTLPTVANAQLGIFGTAALTNGDTVRVPLVTHDTTGLALADMDSVEVLRYFNGLLIDSIHSIATAHAQVVKLGTGQYEIKYQASTHEDSMGQYNVFVRIWKRSSSAAAAFSYVTVKGGLRNIYDISAFLGACDGCIRIIYPIGNVPKDSIIIIDTTGTDERLAKITFNHSVTNRGVDTAGMTEE